jgi:hypothetical protein
VVKRTPDTHDSVLSDVTGTTELDRIPDSPSKRDISNRKTGGPINARRESGQTIGSKNNIVATRIKTYVADGSYTERLQSSDGTTTTMTHSSNDKWNAVSNASGLSPIPKKRNTHDERIAQAYLVTSNSTSPEPSVTEQNVVLDAVCVRACDVHPQPKSDTLARDPRGAVAGTATRPRGERDRQRVLIARDSRASKGHDQGEDDIHSSQLCSQSAQELATETVGVKPFVPSGSTSSSDRSFPGASQYSDLSGADALSSTSQVSNNMTYTIRPLSENKPMRVKRTVVTKVIKDPKQDEGRTRAIRLPSDDMSKQDVVRKSTTYSADGSVTEKMIHADGTTTVVKHSSKGSKGTETTGSLPFSTPTSHSAASTNSTASPTNRNGQPRSATKYTHPKTVGNSFDVEQDAQKRIKSRLTTSFSDGSRTEVTVYTDGSKVTKIIAASKKNRSKKR